jgi:hypothetical protein
VIPSTNTVVIRVLKTREHYSHVIQQKRLGIVPTVSYITTSINLSETGKPRWIFSSNGQVVRRAIYHKFINSFTCRKLVSRNTRKKPPNTVLNIPESEKIVAGEVSIDSFTKKSPQDIEQYAVRLPYPE